MPCGRAQTPRARAQLVLSEIGSGSPTSLQAVRALAVFLKEPSQRDSVVEEARAWLADPSTAGNHVALLVAARLHALRGETGEALKICHNAQDLEL